MNIHHGGREARRLAGVVVLAGAWLACAIGAPLPLAGTGDAGAPQQIEANADKLDYDREQGIVEGVGRVVIKRGDTVLKADYVRVDVNTEQAEAFGDVTLTRGEDVWTGPSLNYNFRTGAGLTSSMKVTAAPFYVRADSSERAAEGQYVLRNAWVSTCDPDEGPVDFHVTAKKMEVVPGEYLKARGAVWWFGSVPSMYLPYWYRDLNSESGFRFVPGYSSENGAFLLSSYHYRLNPGVTAATRLDYRTERGVAGGQDFAWNTGENQHVGDFKAYYADDQKPLDDDDIAAGEEIDADRYRVRLHDQFVASERDLVLARGHYLSDPDILEDFYEDEFREERQPDNFVNYTHRGDLYTAGVIGRTRLNNFYENVNRLPEASVDMFRQSIADSPFYYESQSAGGFIQRVFPDGGGTEDYDVFRFDTEHTVFYPDKYFGFLTLVPRAGARATYYSDTRRTETVNASTIVLQTNFVVSAGGVTNAVVTSTTSTNAVTRDVAAGSDTRGLIELGFETSYKAFQTYDTAYGPRRHIVEPFADYTLIPEPSVTPDTLYQFDEVDQVDEQHTVDLGVRQKWQEKREAGAYDLIDLEVSTTFNIHKADGEDTLEFLNWDGEFRPVDGWAIDVDGAYNLPDGELDTLNWWLLFNGARDLTARTEFRYRRDDSSLLFADLTLFPEARWSYNGYGRYEFETSRLEEIGGYVQHIFTCVGLRIGSNFLPGYTRSDGFVEDDEFRFLVEFWLTAFPDSALGGRHSS